MARRTKFLTICGNIIIFVVVANTINLLAREINKYYIALYKPIYNKIWEEKESKSKTNTQSNHHQNETKYPHQQSVVEAQQPKY